MLRSFAFALLFYGTTAVLAVVGLPTLLMPRAAVERYGQFWVRLSLAMVRGILGIDAEVRGNENRPAQPAIYAVKHQSAWDTLAFNLLVPGAVYVMKAELLLIPLWGWYVRRSGMIAIDRKGGAAATRRMTRDARHALERARSIVLFPQGTRVRPGEKRPYHRGVAALYAATKVPVVPVALNSGLFWPRRAFRKRPGKIVVAFLPPVPPGLEPRDMMKIVEERIETESDLLAEEGRSQLMDHGR